MKWISLRRLGVTAVAAVVALGASVLTPAEAPAREFKLASFVSPQHPMHDALMAPLGQRIDEMSNSELTVRIFASGELGRGPVQQYQRAVTGVADMVFGLHGYTSSEFPRTLLIELPGISNGPEQATRMLWAAREQLNGDYEQVVPLALWTNGPATLIMRDKPIRTPADLQGLKLRVPSESAARIVQAWGASPEFMPAPAIYQAMTTGTIDGVFIGGSGVRSFRLHEAAKYMTTNVPTTVAAFYVLMSRSAYEGLSESERNAIDNASGLEVSLMGARRYQQAWEDGIRLFGEGSDREVIELSDEQRAAFMEAASGVRDATLEQLSEQGIDGAPIIDAMEAGRE